MTEPIDWREISEQWRSSALRWQKWASELLRDFGRQPPNGQHGDDAARQIIGALVRITDPTKEKNEWVSAPRGSVLHRVAVRHNIVDQSGGWRESFLDGGKVLRTKCQRTMRLVSVGVFDRVNGKRCDRCCDAMGITRGYGCPINDETCRRTK